MYIAQRPVRFDRDYAIGETIPEELIDPRVIKRLIYQGVISYSPTTQETPLGTQNRPKNEVLEVEQVNTQTEGENTQEGQISDAGDDRYETGEEEQSETGEESKEEEQAASPTPPVKTRGAQRR